MIDRPRTGVRHGDFGCGSVSDRPRASVNDGGPTALVVKRSRTWPRLLGSVTYCSGHIGLAESGVDFDTDSQLTADALTTFAAGVPKLDPVAYAFQGYPFNRAMYNAISNRLTQVLVGELTLDEAMVRMQEDVDNAIAEATGE